MCGCIEDVGFTSHSNPGKKGHVHHLGVPVHRIMCHVDAMGAKSSAKVARSSDIRAKRHSKHNKQIVS